MEPIAIHNKALRSEEGHIRRLAEWHYNLERNARGKTRPPGGSPLLRYREQTTSTQADLQTAQRLILYISLLTALLTEQRRREKMKIKGFWPMLTTTKFCTKLCTTTFISVVVLIL